MVGPHRTRRPNCCSQKSQHPSAPALLKTRHRGARRSAKLAEVSSPKARAGVCSIGCLPSVGVDAVLSMQKLRTALRWKFGTLTKQRDIMRQKWGSKKRQFLYRFRRMWASGTSMRGSSGENAASALGTPEVIQGAPRTEQYKVRCEIVPSQRWHPGSQRSWTAPGFRGLLRVSRTREEQRSVKLGETGVPERMLCLLSYL